METIEIGLVVIDLETLEVVDEFQRFVRSQINPVLTDFCKQLTSIQQADVDSAGTYVEVGQELGAFITRYPNAAWASWGDYDARQLERDAGFAALPSRLEGLPHLNARRWHAGNCKLHQAGTPDEPYIDMSGSILRRPHRLR